MDSHHHHHPHDNNTTAVDGAVIRPPPSQLGNRHHWDSLYLQEAAIFQQRRSGNGDDDGGALEVWFGEDKQDRLLQFIEEEVFIIGCGDSGGSGSGDSGGSGNGVAPGTVVVVVVVVDIGTGNGVFLVELWRRLRESNTDTTCADDVHHRHHHRCYHLLGVDYSEPSVELAARVASAACGHDAEAGVPSIRFRQHDIVDGGPIEVHAAVAEGSAGGSGPLGLLLLHDKGTYDAICLNEDRGMPERYRRNVHNTMAKVVAENSGCRCLYLITSCNFSRDELEMEFCTPNATASSSNNGTLFRVVNELPHESFEFGGVRGQTVTTLLMEAVL